MRVAGHAEPYYVLAPDARSLKALAAGRRPRGWQLLATTTEAETVFLAPLDIVSGRGRGYYVLSILWADRLVGRLDRASGTLFLDGFWLEQRDTGRDEAFAAWNV